MQATHFLRFIFKYFRSSTRLFVVSQNSSGIIWEFPARREMHCGGNKENVAFILRHAWDLWDERRWTISKLNVSLKISISTRGIRVWNLYRFVLFHQSVICQAFDTFNTMNVIENLIRSIEKKYFKRCKKGLKLKIATLKIVNQTLKLKKEQDRKRIFQTSSLGC